MKWTHITLFMFLCIAALNCSNSNEPKDINITNTEQMKTENTTEIILHVIPTPHIPIGYGMVYNCKIVKKTKGTIEDEQMKLVILAGDKENQAFMDSYSSDNPIEMGFSKNKENEPYATMPITGFVDAEKTSWNVVYMKETNAE